MSAFLPSHARPCVSISPLSCQALCQHSSLIMPDPVSVFLSYHDRLCVSMSPLSYQATCQHFFLIMSDPESAFLPYHARPRVSISPLSCLSPCRLSCIPVCSANLFASITSLDFQFPGSIPPVLLAPALAVYLNFSVSPRRKISSLYY